MYIKKLIKILCLVLSLNFAITACSGSGERSFPSLDFGSPPDTPFTIHDESELIGGPIATGRVGDVLMQNDKIRVIIQKPAKNSWVGSFGGQIVDADRVRKAGEPGNDNFQFMLPIINIEWSMNTYDYEVVADGSDGGPKILRSHGVIDVYDYLDLDFISPVAKALTDQSLYFSPRFDDINEPFTTMDLANIDPFVTQEFRLDPGSNYIRMDLTISNRGDEEVKLPVGSYVNGGGRVQLLIPGLGFQPDTMTEVAGDVPCLIFTASPGSDVSYGYFYDMRQFAKVEESGAVTRLPGTSLSYSGVTGFIFGEQFLKLLPLGGRSQSEINFSIPPQSSRTITTYFVVGDGSPGSVMDAGLKILEIPSHRVSGRVVDSLGTPVANATVLIENEQGSVIVTHRTDAKGEFSGNVSSGGDSFAKSLGSGKYNLEVYKPGYVEENGIVAGTCLPAQINLANEDASDVVCTLGVKGHVRVVGGVTDAETGAKIPARMTVVGFDPSLGDQKSGNRTDMMAFPEPFAVRDIEYFNAKGTIGLDGRDSITIEPGRYVIVFSRGPEYSTEVREVNVLKEGITEIVDVKLRRVMKTQGFVSGDFHLHSILSPDSAVLPAERALSAAGEGLDILMSTDHDCLVDYGPVVAKLEAEGIIPQGSATTIVGDEVSPNHIGHFNGYPLEYDNTKVCGGALDWTYSPSDEMSPKADMAMSPQQVIDYFKDLPGEHVVQMNHLMDQSTSILSMGGWVMSTAYASMGVPVLSSYGDPVQNRLAPHAPGLERPFPYGSTEMMATGFTAVELTIGPELWRNHLKYGGLPLWFNMLNLGWLVTATSDSDSHTVEGVPIGLPRNYVASSVDPKDGSDQFTNFSKDEFVDAINNHHVVVTAGPFITMTAVGDDGTPKRIGDVVKGKSIRVRVDVKAASWAWFDTIEIYANTEPVPADSDTGEPLAGAAADPSTFYEPYHVPRYYYEPIKTFRVIEGTMQNWAEKDGVISATVDFVMDVEEDTWVVAFVTGTQETPGFRSLFPLVPHTLKTGVKEPELPDNFKLEDFWLNPDLQAPAWAFTNPIFIDVDGDVNGDGVDFESLYIRSGVSPLAGIKSEGGEESGASESTAAESMIMTARPQQKAQIQTQNAETAPAAEMNQILMR